MDSVETPWWRRVARSSFLWLFALAMAIAITLILSFNLVRPSNVDVTLGLPAANDILAPRSITYTSDVLTAQAVEQARASVADVYTTLDPSIGRAQLSTARAIFAFVEVVRGDTYATSDAKLGYLQAIDGLEVEDQVGTDLLGLNPDDYAEAKDAVLTVIEELMSQEIREDQLSDYKRLARRPSLVLTPIQDNIVTKLAYQFIVSNVFLNEEATAEKRTEAVSAVNPVTRTITEGQRVIRAGDIISELDIEMLEQLGLLQAETDWRDVGSIFMASLLGVVIVTLYWQQFYDLAYTNGRYLSALVIFVFIFTIAARLIISGPPYLVYWFPIATLAMLLSVVFDARLSALITIMMAVEIGFIAPNSLELSMYIGAGGLMAVLLLRDAQRVNAFFRAGLAAAVGHIAVIIIFQLPQDGDILTILQELLYGLGNGVLSAALTLLGLFLVGGMFGVITILQLQELSRLDHPLLQELLRRAPGTYHHSIMVANLAEQAAERVRGTNSALVRVGAFYHDIGKMKRPPFFTENQEGNNPHDALDPYSSARIIVNHVSDGLELAKKYRLPHRIRDFIAEHHGTRIVKGFYLKALALADGDESRVDKDKLRYAGPRPRSRETGIVMMADSVEATSSALHPSTEKAIEKLVNGLIDEHVTEGQLNRSGLTLGDIQVIRASFIETLKGRFHVRVKYPGNEELEVGNVPVAVPATAVPAPSPAPVANPIEIPASPAAQRLDEALSAVPNGREGNTQSALEAENQETHG
ncbi:MAG: HDIG domain-containing protein [Ardenticatenaceae bacterium]|nr:HDIG domain-containing protein [Anaerolineales bacterium]MCB8921927.1 HDIG domain-containing protein [Ardenticatenaceae bacterium]MCB8989502.1 HDIG domain-containing protein [Ardenticatenaceae bacterium]MCB9003046.1 HDIG domain-containing protein [Ardenticatenaceae bacterium]